MRKRRRGFPSETAVKRGDRTVRGVKELAEKLGRNDLCPCGSGRRFQGLLHEERAVRRSREGLLLLGNDKKSAPTCEAGPIYSFMLNLKLEIGN